MLEKREGRGAHLVDAVGLNGGVDELLNELPSEVGKDVLLSSASERLVSGNVKVLACPSGEGGELGSAFCVDPQSSLIEAAPHSKSR